jgi:hypothetical protein
MVVKARVNIPYHPRHILGKSLAITQAPKAQDAKKVMGSELKGLS